MADPKIKYDIEATATGAAEVDRLAAEIEKLDAAFDPAVAARARELANEVRALGSQQQAVASFVQLKEQLEGSRTALTGAQEAAQAFARSIADTETPTRSQAGQMQKLADAVRAAKADVQAQTEALDASRAALASLGLSTEGLAQKEIALRSAVQGTLQEVQALGQQQAAVQRFQELVAASERASSALGSASGELAQFRSAMSSTSAPTAAEAAELERLVSAAHAAQVALQEEANAQTRAADVARAAGASLESLAAAQARGRDQATATATAAGQVASAYQRVGAAALTSGQEQSAAAAKTVTVLESLKGQLSALQQIAGAAIGGTIVGGLAKSLGETADSYANLSARIKIATGDGAAFTQSLQGVFAVAQRTGSAVDEVGKLFVKLTQAGQKLGLTNQDALRLTETITQATQLSGEAAESANAAITQFAQGLSAGVLRGQDLNSVLEQAPRLSKALADGLGFTTGELKKLGEAGSLTAQQVIGALQGQSAAVQREFDQLPPTIGRAITSLSNNWTAYIGQVDKATGASTTAARAIAGLGNNLETIGALLFSAGKAAAAYSAINLARTFLANAAAATASAEAKAVETAATQANTVATQANTAAKAANASATAAAGTAGIGAAASVGKFAAVLSSLKLFSLIGIVTNFREIGTAIGEGAAKLFGYDRPLRDLELATKADEQAARANAQAKTELAQKLQLAADKALGLTDQSRKLIGIFDEEKTKGEETSVALEKVAKALELSDLSGITNGITALDALAARGKITGTALHDALSSALKDVDLNVFAINAEAAFDKSETGARRLKEALDAVGDEALRRAGTSLQELTTGFSNGATKAINDLDALSATLVKLGVTGDDAARVLAGALDKATEAAGTERAVRAVMDRFADLGKQGLLTGQQVSDGLAKAQEKIDNLTPGIKGLAEAARKFGTDVPELMTGVSKAFSDSVTEVSKFGEELSKAKVTAERVSPILADALDKRIAAARTREELELLRTETEKLGAAGKLMGGDYTAALDKIKAKALELTPAMRQLQQDAETLGIKIGTAATGSAEKVIAAYERIKSSGKASSAEVQDAFVAMANKVIAANGGIVPEWVKVEAATRGATIATNEFGEAAVSVAKTAAAGFDSLGEQLNATAGSLSALTDKANAARDAIAAADSAAAAKSAADRDELGKQATAFVNSPSYLLQQKQASGTLTSADAADAQRNFAAASANLQQAQRNLGAFSTAGYQSILAAYNQARQVLEAVGNLGKNSGTILPGAPPASGSGSTAGPSSVTGTVTPLSAAGSTNHTVTVNIAGATTSFNTATAADAAKVTAMLQSLESAARSAGY